MELVVATSNPHKLRELKELLAGLNVVLTDLSGYGYLELPPEDGATFLDNARIKARAVAEKIKNKYILADDSGLRVYELNGMPGVMSARYAGHDRDYKANNEKLLHELQKVPDGKRGAEFVCSIVLIAPNGREYDVEGKCVGRIIHELHGDGGFGYDPLFVPEGFEKTFAELAAAEKNKISHRGRALAKLIEVIRRIQN